MSEYILTENLYLGITPGGTYYAVQDKAAEPGREFLHRLLQEAETPLFNVDVACELSGYKKKRALEFVHWMQEAGLIAGLERSERAPQETLERLLPQLLRSMSDEGKAILAESRGLYLGSAGYTHEAAEELAALSANLTAVYARHKELLQGNLGYRQRAWGLVDASGNSEVGFWPLYIGQNRFTLIIGGVPQFNQPDFKRLVWALEMRYGNTEIPV
ncbi:MAG TPA: hypothetical protein PLE99_08170 [Candidatus Thiothrix moscowensis]|uniref:hypothetical protein n=1 Tax=unclassified Thiothrix TaxID=2636184 RepID=UPI001A25847F|nr:MULTISPECIES: hypothetical protein [unclassified Thiothrix]MBJ6610512.1 hypothetical protein [Candidatus Thiothrix moscowensis]HRJ52729.1 hypothetical protein [Candidatus Thiothrix moscowensis]HRJ92787.1 hypothetical protein [Candidatus Thiothrix moscowensis]